MQNACMVQIIHTIPLPCTHTNIGFQKKKTTTSRNLHNDAILGLEPEISGAYTTKKMERACTCESVAIIQSEPMIQT